MEVFANIATTVGWAAPIAVILVALIKGAEAYRHRTKKPESSNNIALH